MALEHYVGCWTVTVGKTECKGPTSTITQGTEPFMHNRHGKALTYRRKVCRWLNDVRTFEKAANWTMCTERWLCLTFLHSCKALIKKRQLKNPRVWIKRRKNIIQSSKATKKQTFFFQKVAQQQQPQLQNSDFLRKEMIGWWEQALDTARSSSLIWDKLDRQKQQNEGLLSWSRKTQDFLTWLVCACPSLLSGLRWYRGR